MFPKRPEDVFINLLRSAYRNTRHGTSRLTPLRAGTRITSRSLSSLTARPAIVCHSIGTRETRDQSGKLPQVRTRGFATAATDNGKQQREIAVLGGGITGLTTAHYLARHAPDANITLYEASPKLGGWVEGNTVRVGDGENDQVLFQHGPRMLRPGGTSPKYDDLVFYDVVADLDIGSKLHSFSNTSDRYIYYPDHLVKMPSPNPSLSNIVNTITSLFTEPLWDGAFRSGLGMMLSNPSQSPDTNLSERLARDVSVGEFLETELNVDPRLVRNLASAMMHGIYGGDVYKLSAKCTMLENAVRAQRLPQAPGHRWVENKDLALVHDILAGPNRTKLIKLAEFNANKSIMMFEDGLMTLVDAMVKDLESRGNVTIETNSRVDSLAKNGEQVLISTKKSTQQYDQVISTLFSKHLASLVTPQTTLPSLSATQAVTISVVNLWFPNPNLLTQNPGFGYLIPATTPQNEECILGVLFDSCLAIPNPAEPQGTKLTVMLGGHHWDGWPHHPTNEMAKEMAVQAVRRHLHISEDEPFVADVALCRDCIPQHHVGHRARMAAAHYELLAAFGGKVSVAGPSYTTVGVIPAMRAGFDVAMRVATGRAQPWFNRQGQNGSDGNGDSFDHVGATGLEGFAEGDEVRDVTAVLAGEMLLRRSSDPDHRFTDGRGNWLRE